VTKNETIYHVLCLKYKNDNVQTLEFMSLV
jgi:hypothetical protein